MTINERLVRLLSEAFDLAKDTDTGKDIVKFGDGGKSYVF